MQREPQQAALAAVGHQRAYVEKRRGQNYAAAHDADHPRLLDDEELPRPVSGGDDIHGGGEPAGDELRLDRQGSVRGSCRYRQDGE